MGAFDTCVLQTHEVCVNSEHVVWALEWRSWSWDTESRCRALAIPPGDMILMRAIALPRGPKVPPG